MRALIKYRRQQYVNVLYTLRVHVCVCMCVSVCVCGVCVCTVSSVVYYLCILFSFFSHEIPMIQPSCSKPAYLKMSNPERLYIYIYIIVCTRCVRRLRCDREKREKRTSFVL